MSLRVFLAPFIAVVVLTGCQAAGETDPDDIHDTLRLLPAPKQVHMTPEHFEAPHTLHCSISDEELAPLLGIISYEYERITGGNISELPAEENPLCRLELDPELDEEEYHLNVDSHITISGGSYRAVAMGTVTLMQMIHRHEEGIFIPQIEMRDWPDSEYRGVLIDVARNWHDVSVLKQLIHLCRWYKINYMQLHFSHITLREAESLFS
jgi:hexosaminidase